MVAAAWGLAQRKQRRMDEIASFAGRDEEEDSLHADSSSPPIRPQTHATFLQRAGISTVHDTDIDRDTAP